MSPHVPLRVRPETSSVFSKPCVRVSGRRDGRRDAGASQGRLDAPGREHKAPVGRAGRAPLPRQRPSTMLQHRLRPVSWRGYPSNSLKIRYMSPDGLRGGGILVVLQGSLLRIPSCTDQNPYADFHRPMEMIVQGRSVSFFHASQHRPAIWS